MIRLGAQTTHNAIGAALLFLFCHTMAWAEAPAPHILKGLGEECVAPVDEMRRNHMEMLEHQRDDTVHLGIRPKNAGSLKGCIACHAQKDNNGSYIPINAPGQFCESCHRYAAVSTDCFQCHATKPEQE